MGIIPFSDAVIIPIEFVARINATMPGMLQDIRDRFDVPHLQSMSLFGDVLQTGLVAELLSESKYPSIDSHDWNLEFQ